MDIELKNWVSAQRTMLEGSVLCAVTSPLAGTLLRYGEGNAGLLVMDYVAGGWHVVAELHPCPSAWHDARLAAMYVVVDVEQTPVEEDPGVIVTELSAEDMDADTVTVMPGVGVPHDLLCSGTDCLPCSVRCFSSIDGFFLRCSTCLRKTPQYTTKAEAIAAWGQDQVKSLDLNCAEA